MSNLLIPAIVACAIFFLVGGVVSFAMQSLNRDRKATRRRLEDLAQLKRNQRSIEVDRDQRMSEVPWLARLMEKPLWAERLARKVRQAKAPGSPGLYVLLGLALAVTAVYVVFLFTGQLFPGLAVAVACFYAPFFWLGRRHAKRMNAFQTQLADALELVARSMRAGHTFTGGLRMAVDEFPDPIAEEFGQLLDEINYGVDMDLALRGLLDRVDCSDLKFFVVSVNVQRETGGNLAEIIGSIASLIRERFKLYGKIQVLSAEGRMSAWILLALPFVITLVLWVMNPEYIGVLFTDPTGRNLIWGALTSMAFGFVVIRRMIKIKV